MAGAYVQEARRAGEETYIVGVELSGNPTVRCRRICLAHFEIGSFETFLPALNLARGTYGLPISVHYAEIVNYEESMKILQFKPERLGHGCHIVRYYPSLSLKFRMRN